MDIGNNARNIYTHSLPNFMTTLSDQWDFSSSNSNDFVVVQHQPRRLKPIQQQSQVKTTITLVKMSPEQQKNLRTWESKYQVLMESKPRIRPLGLLRNGSLYSNVQMAPSEPPPVSPIPAVHVKPLYQSQTKQEKEKRRTSNASDTTVINETKPKQQKSRSLLSKIYSIYHKIIT